MPFESWYSSRIVVLSFLCLLDNFLKELGADLVISPPTNKLIIQRGLTYGVDEICFPVKVFLGHCHYLKDKVDSLLCPVW